MRDTGSPAKEDDANISLGGAAGLGTVVWDAVPGAGSWRLINPSISFSRGIAMHLLSSSPVAVNNIG